MNGFTSYNEQNQEKLKRPENMRETLAKIAIQKEKQAKISRLQLRYYGACAAMTGIIAGGQPNILSENAATVVKIAYEAADLMLAEFDRQVKELEDLPKEPT